MSEFLVSLMFRDCSNIRKFHEFFRNWAIAVPNFKIEMLQFKIPMYYYACMYNR